MSSAFGVPQQLSQSRRDLMQYGALEQVAGFTRYQLSEGFEASVEMIELRTGAGLRVGICPSRGLDLPFAELNGTNLTWRHPNGVVHPAFYNEGNFGWLRGAPCGLLSTCGLNSFGPPCEEEGEAFGIHDRIAWIPARDVSTRTFWEKGEHGEECWFEVRGTLRQTRLFGTNLRLERTLRAKLGENRLLLRDELTNDGFEAAPAVVLYHCNFGYPLLEPGTQVLCEGRTQARDADAQTGIYTWNQVEAPTPGYAEQVFFHELESDSYGRASAALWNSQRQMGVRLNFSKAQLPFFTQWKMLGAGAYVMGLEPSNAPLGSRAELREKGVLPSLEAGQTHVFEIEWEFGQLF